MSKLYVALASLCAMFSLGASAQTILSEDFETESTEISSLPVTVGEGWIVVNGYTGDNVYYTWHNYYAKDGHGSGSKHVACCDAPTYSGAKDGFGPREETLLTPELDLQDTYELRFDWAAGPMAAKADSKFDLQVRIVENGNLGDAETIFSIHDAQLLKESGVLKWNEDWAFYTSKLDLSEWKGKKVKVAFVFKMFTNIGNQVELDNVSVYRIDPVTGPVASISMDSYNFGEMYIGEKCYTEPIILKNVGKGNLRITSVEMPDGVGSTLIYDRVNLEKNDEIRFQLTYTARLTNSAEPLAVMHTTGGDVNIQLRATKTFVPEGYTLENFEGYFPPAGWKVRNWRGTETAIEGDQTAYAGRDINEAVLTSPRLDLTNGGQLTFTYYDFFESYEGDTYPNNDFRVEVSTDGGNYWTKAWEASYEFTTSYQATQTVDLGSGTDNSYVRFVLTAVEYDQDEGAAEGRDIYLDRVLLPNLYGLGGVPGAVELTAPADGVKGIYPRDLTLTWTPAQFANGYKLYVGSNDEATNLIDGLDVKDALSYTIARLDYETTYFWKVVAYNENGTTLASSIQMRHFTTQPDASVAQYPYIEDFKEKNIPNGWLAVAAPTYNRNWYVNTYFPYRNGDVQSNALTSSYMAADGESNYILTPEFKLPADKTMQISFFWGDEHPSDLIVDETGLLKKQNVEPNNGVSEGIFSILVDDEWVDLTRISEDASLDKKYWREEVVNLAAYAGKTVQFRWFHKAYNSGPDGGTSVAHVVLEVLESDKAIFNKPSWAAGKVNYGKGNSSGDILTVLNKGQRELKVKSVTFATDNFGSSLQPGTDIAVDGGVTFSVQFYAKDSNRVIEDKMTIEFESGYKVSLPVSGEGLASDVLYYTFEPNDMDYLWREDFTMIDVDKAVAPMWTYYLTNFEMNGLRYAFTGVEHFNDNLTAYTGNHTIAASAGGNSADNWLISRKLYIGQNASFDFYARNLGTNGSVFIGDNDYHCVGVYVSEAGNTNTNDFSAVMRDTQMPYLDNNQWNHFTVDLSEYAGKEIYVAVRHTAVSANWFALFDEFTFNHVGLPGTGISDIASSQSNDAAYDLSGRRVVAPKKGLYIVNGKKVVIK